MPKAQKPFGGQSMVARLRRVLVRRPDESFAAADPERWNYASAPNLERARANHDALVAVLRASGAEVYTHDEDLPDLADSVFVCDPLLMTNRGAIVLSMGKQLRRGEEEALAARVAALGVPIMARLFGPARAEGGDFLWLDAKTLAVGLGFRTNREGVRQVGKALGGTGVALVPVELPYAGGPDACLHLLSLISLVGERRAVVYPRLMSVPFWRLLKARGFELIEVPEEEFARLGTNILALGPDECVMLEGNPVTQARLEAAGCRVHTFPGDELCLKAEGGPTCLTLALQRGEPRR